LQRKLSTGYGDLDGNDLDAGTCRSELDPRPSPVKLVPKPRIIPDFTGPTCSWPIGHPGEKTFHFCTAKPVGGKPYCAEHVALAYIKPRNSNAA
jgi:hypothetical protein